MRRLIICLVWVLVPAFAAPAIYQGGVVNGADFTLNFSPGMLVSVFGTNLATVTKVAPGFPLPASIDGVSVEVIDGARTLTAPLFFVSAGQINAQLPFDITSASVQVRVKNATGTSGTQSINIAARCPRILTKTMNGLGEAIVTHADYRVVSTSAPALAGEVVILFLAGLGAVSPQIAAGQAAGTNPLNVVQDEVVVKVDGAAAKVHYKGLAPYFAGLYQLNFQVPETAQQGINELTVEMGTRVSQGRVQFAVARGTTSLTSGSIPTGGGAVAAGGFSMSVPAGAFPAATAISIVQASTGLPEDSGRASEVYGISGLPSTTAAPISLAVNFTETIPAGSKGYLAVQMPGFNGGIMYLPGTVEGNRLAATLPANAGKSVTGAVQRRAESGIDASYWVWMTILGEPYLSESRLFRIRQMPGVSIANLNIVAKAFVDAALMPGVNRLNEWGFKFPGGTSAEPRTVEIAFERLSGAEKLLCGGDVFYDAHDGEVRIRLNSRLIEYDTQGPNYSALSRKVVHVLFHYIRFPDGPAAASYPWLWMDEAAASWLERKLAMLLDPKEYVPLQEMAFWNFAPRGVEASASTTDREDLMIHGWGASRFIETVAIIKGTDLLKEIYKVHGTPGLSALKPVEALRSDVLGPGLKVDLGALWEFFVNSEGPGTFLLPDRGNLTDAVGSRNGTLQGKAGEKIVFDWSAPHLSAQFFQVNMPAQWSSGLALSAAATGDSDITVYYYRVPASGSPEVLPEKNAFERKPPETVFKSGDRLWIVAVNKKAVSPFTSRSPVTVTVEVKATAPSIVDWVKATPYVVLHMDGYTATCLNQPTDGKPFESQCSGGLLLQNTDSSQKQVQAIRWNGLSFSYSGTIYYPGSIDPVHEISGSGVLSSDGLTIESGQFYDKMIGTDIVRIEEIQVGGLPYVNPYGFAPRADNLSYPYKLVGAGPVSKAVTIFKVTETLKGKPFSSLIRMVYKTDAELTVTFQRPFP